MTTKEKVTELEKRLAKTETALSAAIRHMGAKICPDCGAPVIAREGKFGPFWACLAWCGYTKSIKRPAVLQEAADIVNRAFDY
jgi:ssDNA-binding Zn-finger/Zn-ribbon topoisomerase 1